MFILDVELPHKRIFEKFNARKFLLVEMSINLTKQFWNTNSSYQCLRLFRFINRFSNLKAKFGGLTTSAFSVPSVNPYLREELSNFLNSLLEGVRLIDCARSNRSIGRDAPF